MNRKLLAIPVLLIFVTVMFAPMTVSEGTDANDDIVIPPMERITLDPSSSKTVYFTMFNNGTDNYMFQLKDYESDCIHISCTYADAPEIVSKDYKTVAATITVDRYVHKGDYDCNIDISLLNLVSGSSSSKTFDVKLSITSFYSDDQYNKILGLFSIGIDSPEINAAITFVIWLAITAIVICAYNRIIAHFFGSDPSDGRMKKKVSWIWFFVIMLYGTYNTLLVYGANERLLDMFWAGLQIVYVILIALIVWHIYKSVVYYLFHKMEKKEGFEGVDTSLIPLFNMIGKVAIGGIGTAILLATLGVNIAGILTGAGVIGLAISLGAQNILTQMFGGMTLMLTRPFIKDDMIRLGDDSTVYEVVDIGLLNTELKEWSNTPHIIMPNSVVASSKITNMTSTPHAYRVYIFTGVDYDSDIELAKKVMVEAAKEHPHVVFNDIYPEPTVRLESFDDSAIMLRLSVYVDNFDDSSIYMGEIREIMVRKMNENGIEIPYAIYDVDLKD